MQPLWLSDITLFKKNFFTSDPIKVSISKRQIIFNKMDALKTLVTVIPLNPETRIHWILDKKLKILNGFVLKLTDKKTLQFHGDVINLTKIKALFTGRVTFLNITDFYEIQGYIDQKEETKKVYQAVYTLAQMVVTIEGFEKSVFLKPSAPKEITAIRILSGLTEKEKSYFILPYEIYESESETLLVYDKSRLRSLKTEIERRKAVKQQSTFFNQEVEQIMIQVLEGLDVLHSNDLVHLDLDPENIYLEEIASGQYLIKLGNFHKALFMKNLEIQKIKGTQQLTVQSYKGVDIFDLGVLYYKLQNKFKDQTNRKIPCVCLRWLLVRRALIVLGRSSDERKNQEDLFRKMTHIDPYLRLTASDALIHPYFGEVQLQFLESYRSVFQMGSMSNMISIAQSNIQVQTSIPAPSIELGKTNRLFIPGTLKQSSKIDKIDYINVEDAQPQTVRAFPIFKRPRGLLQNSVLPELNIKTFREMHLNFFDTPRNLSGSE